MSCTGCHDIMPSSLSACLSKRFEVLVVRVEMHIFFLWCLDAAALEFSQLNPTATAFLTASACQHM